MMQSDRHWIAVWTASPQGPYPAGNPSAQLDLSSVLPDPAAGAARQSLRMIVKPGLWGRAFRIRFSNVFGAKTLVLSHGMAGVHAGGGGIRSGTAVPLTFQGLAQAEIPRGADLWSNDIVVPLASSDLQGRALAVSFYLPEATGPMTWHAKALQTSYLSPPGEPVTDDRTGLAFPFSTTSWFFIDRVDMDVPGGRTIAAFGDSLTDGTFSTLNGDDRWPDFLQRRLIAAGYDTVAVVNAGIGGNQIVGPGVYDPASPVPGGPSARERMGRDVIGLVGLSAVIWLEGTNDCSLNGCGDPAQIIAGYEQGVARLRKERPGLRVIGATLPGAAGSSAPAHGTAAQDRCRRALNDYIRESGLFDAILDFEAATTDRETGRLFSRFVPDSTMGGPGDGLHPNRAGYAAMAAAIDLNLLGL